MAANEKKNGVGADITMTREELLRFAEKEAQAILHVSAAEAFKQLDEGKLSGKPVEAEFAMFRHLLGK